MEKSVGFRSGDEADIPLIQELINRIWPATYSHIITPEQTLYMLDMMYSETALRTQMAAGHHFVIATINHLPAGFASWERKTDSRCRLHKLYVLPDSQGSGIGKKLVSYIRQLVAQQGCNTIELNVNRHNTARGFYEKMGFEMVREEDNNIGGGYFMNDYVMQIVEK